MFGGNENNIYICSVIGRKNHITAFHLIYIGRKKSDLVKPHEACKRYCKREQRKFTFNLLSAAISYPMSKAKFVHARDEK